MKVLKVLGNTVHAAVGAYGVVIAICLVLRLFVNRFVPMMIFDIVVPIVLFPGLVFLAIYVLGRRWRLAALQLPILIGFLWMYGYFFLPERVPAVSEDTQISILTYNISLSRRGVENEAALIRDANADVVTLQEVGEVAGEYFDTELADLYPYRAIHAGESPPGQAVLSRYPIVEDMVWEVERMHQRVVLDVNGQNVTVYNVHPIHFHFDREGLLSFEGQLREVDDILARAAEETNSMLIAGDFNTTDQSDIYEDFTASYGDAFRHAGIGFGFTFPARLPLARLDYVFYTDEFTALDAHVWETSGGSDHFPVYAHLELAGTG